MPATLTNALSPIIDSGLSLKEMRVILNEMYANSVCNPPDGEMDNFTAKRQTPVFLALSKFLESIDKEGTPDS